MAAQAQEVLQAVLTLTPAERVAIVEQTLLSVHQPDPRTEEAWAREVENRIAAHEAGRLHSVPADEGLAETALS